MNKARETSDWQRDRTFDTAALLAAVPLTAAAVRIWVFSRGDTAVFRTLLTTLDIPALLVGTIVQLVPAAVVAWIMLMLTDWRFRDRFNTWAEKNTWFRYVFLPTLFILFVTIPLYAVGLTVAVIAIPATLFFQLRKRWKWGREHVLDWIIAPRGDTNGPHTGVTALVLLVTVLLSSSAMWLPLERIQTNDPDQIVVGYVLSSSEVWTTILSNDHEVQRVRTGKVRLRQVCDGSEHFRLADVLADGNTSRDREKVECDS